MRKRLRLLKVIVQPVFVLDDGETLSEVTPQPFVVTAKEWPTYPVDGFLRQFAEAEEQFNPEPGGDQGG
jgi:hypothetical protein